MSFLKILSDYLLILFLFLISSSAYAKNITIGTISIDPTGEIEKITPLVKYLAKKIDPDNIKSGKVVIAKDAISMAHYMKEGKVDIMIESVFPSLLVNHFTDSKILLRRWKKGVSQYSSVIISKNDVENLQQLNGSVIAFDHPYSTTGFFIPKTMFFKNGFQIIPKKHSPNKIIPKSIKYIFSNSDENTFFWVIRDIVKAGAMDYPSYLYYSKEHPNSLKILYKSKPIPRHIVSFRSDISPQLLERLIDLLTHLDQTEEGRLILKNFQNTLKFDRLPIEGIKQMDSFKKTIKTYYREYLK